MVRWFFLLGQTLSTHRTPTPGTKSISPHFVEMYDTPPLHRIPPFRSPRFTDQLSNPYVVLNALPFIMRLPPGISGAVKGTGGHIPTLLPKSNPNSFFFDPEFFSVGGDPRTGGGVKR